MKLNAVFFAAAAAVLLFLVYLSSGNHPPFIPSDDLHKTITADAACTKCHGPGKLSPLKDSHPPKEQCLICHKKK